MNQPKARQMAVSKQVISQAAKPRVRDRIVQPARDPFIRRGIRAVGVDTIACEAGTNKMSFYRCFGSKDALVAEYLRGQEREAWSWWDGTIARHAGNARSQLEALFDARATKTCKLDSRGCATANAAVEISDRAHPARAVVEDFKADMRRRFHVLARETGARDANSLGDSLMLPWEGSYLARLTFKRDHSPAAKAPKAARALIGAHLP